MVMTEENKKAQEEIKRQYVSGEISYPDAVQKLREQIPDLWCIWDRYRVVDDWEKEKQLAEAK